MRVDFHYLFDLQKAYEISWRCSIVRTIHQSGKNLIFFRISSLFFISVAILASLYSVFKKMQCRKDQSSA
jgi:anti-anti-sigma regulatory factor